MVRIVSALVVGQVARIAGGAEALVNAAGVALITGCVHVGAGERERRLGGVIEGRARPICSGVAQRAILREPGGHVVWIGGALIVLQVAGIARSAEAFVNAA